MGREDHLKKLEEKLNSKTVLFDSESLWDELEPRLPKEKKKRRVFFWLFLGMTSMALIGGFFFFNKDLRKTKTEKEYKKPNIAQQLPKDKAIQNSEDILEHKLNVVSKNNESKSNDLTTQATEIHAHQNEQIDLNSQQKKNKPNRSESVDVTLQQTSSEIVHQEKSSQSNFNQSYPIVQLPSENPDQREVSSESSDIFLNEESIEKIVQTSKTASDNSPFSPTQKPNNSLLDHVPTNNQPEADKIVNLEGIEQNISLLSLLPLRNISLVFEQYIPGISHQPNHSKINHKQQRSPWIFSLSSEVNLYKNFEQRTNDTDYANTLDDLTSLQLGYSYGIKFKAMHQKGLFMGVGIQRTTSLEKFKFQNEFTRIEEITNDQAFLFEGEFIAETQEVRKTIRQNVLQYNELTHLNISPFLGYRIQGNINFDFAIAPLISLSHKGTGYLIDNEQVLITDLSHLYDRSGIAFNGFSFEGGISKIILKNIDVGLQFSAMQQIKNIANENMDFKRKINSIGTGIRLTYYFN